MRRLFLSDLHLGPDHPALSRAFIRWCSGPAWDADEIWILGDLFEFWVGDDVGLDIYAREIAALADLGQHRPVHFLGGNRDFLCGKDFAQRATLTLHREPVLLQEGGERLLLLHGDELCTDDEDYQRYRRIVHQRWVQWLFVHAPKPWRLSLASTLRQRSQRRPAPMDITDVTRSAVDTALRRHQAQIMIHGHTHRPARHEESRGTRYVLPDWRPGLSSSFGWLEQNGAQFGFRTLSGQSF